MGTLYALLSHQAARDPGAVALVAPGRAPLCYGRLRAEVDGVARALNGWGIGRGDRVALVLGSGPEAAVAFLGITAAATCAPLNPAYLEQELDFYLTDLGVKAVVVEASQPSAARDVARRLGLRVIDLSPSSSAEAGVFTLSSEGAASPAARAGRSESDDLCLVLHTSGTTSRPKLVPLSQANVHASAVALAAVLALTPADRCLNVMPLFHIHGLSTVYGSLVVGASVACPGAFDPQHFLAWVEELSPSWTTAAPTIHHSILEVAEQRPEVLARHPFRFLRSASAAMPPQLITDLERVFQAPFIEAYGMTEACPPVSSNPLPPGKRKLGSAGRAVPGCQIAIMDEAGGLLSAGQTGEVAVKGPNVMRGYEKSPADTEAAFVDGWFRTGDQGYLDEGGYLFITGRIKEIINRGGEKIAPREVDEAILAHPAVALAATFAIPHFRLGEDVGAAVVLRAGQSVSARDLQAFVAKRVADFKVPRQIVFVDEIPKGPTSKVQRLRLAEKLGLKDAAQIEDKTPYLAPRTPTEEIIASIFSQILKIDQIGIHDNFFRLGGESILAVRVISKIRQILKVTIKVQDFFLGPTVADLARAADALARSAKGQGSAPIPRLAAGADAPLSFVQEGLWFLDQLDPANAAYNVYRAAHLEGPIDPALLERAVREIVRRHEILRTSFPGADGRPRRVVAIDLPIALDRVDLRALSPAERQAEAYRLAVEEARRPFNLATGPLLRTTLLELGPEENILLLTAHHLVFDLSSTGVFFHELAALVAAFAADRPSPLPELPIQHADFAAWQRQQGALFDQQLAYWKKQLADLPPPLDLPTDRPRASARSFRGQRRFFQMPKGLSRAVVALCQKEGVTLFMVLLAAFDALLVRITGQRDIVVGSPIANRNRAEIEDLIGILSNTLVFRVNTVDTPTFKKLLGRVRDVAHGAYAHQDLPFEQLVEGVQPKANRARMPLFQVNFRVQSDPVPTEVLPGVSLRFLKLSNQLAKFDLAIELADAADGIAGFVEYRTDLFNAETIERIIADLEGVLAQVVEKPDIEIAALEVNLKPPARDPAAAKPDAPRLKSFRDVKRKAVDLSRVSLVKRGQLTLGASLPLLLEPERGDVDLADWARSHRSEIEADLKVSGAILFRGFGLASVADFEKVAEAICPDLFGEYGDLPRESVGGRIYGSTPYPMDQAILFHNESAHLPRWPMRQLFFCVEPSPEGGETPLLDCREVYRRLPARIRDPFAEKGLLYTRTFSGDLDVSWQSFFHTTDRAAVEAACAALGMRWEWTAGDGLRLKNRARAVARHPVTGEMVFFNQIQLHHISCLEKKTRESLRALFKEEDLPRNVVYGDGSPIEDCVMEEIGKLYFELCQKHPWQKGDLYLLDNMLVAHARMPFLGPRKIVVAMGEMMNDKDLPEVT